MAGNSPKIMRYKELVGRTTENTNRCLNTMKVCTPVLKEKTENSGHHEDPSDEENDENKEQVVLESKTGDEVKLIGETGQEKPVAKNGTPEKRSDNIGERNGSNGDKKNVNRVKPSEESTKAVANNSSNKITDYSRQINASANGEGRVGGGSSGGGQSRRISNDDSDKKTKKVLKEVGLFALKTAAISGVVIGGTAVILPAIGFGALGVTGGSLAAAYQRSVLGGTIASGSIFATLQRIGMAGLSAAANTAIVAGSSVALGVHSIHKNIKKSKNKK